MSPIKRFCIALTCALISHTAQGQAPAPQIEKISAAQWQQILDETKSISGSAAQQTPGQLLVLVNRADRQEAHFFSTPEAPAHPAIVSVVFGPGANGSPGMQVLGRYAGSKEAFDPWMKGVLARVSGGGGK